MASIRLTPDQVRGRKIVLQNRLSRSYGDVRTEVDRETRQREREMVEASRANAVASA